MRTIDGQQSVSGSAVDQRARRYTTNFDLIPGSVHQWIAAESRMQKSSSLLYLTALSRPPLPEEQQTAQNHVKANEDRTRALEDIAWAVINSKEFLFQH